MTPVNQVRVSSQLSQPLGTANTAVTKIAKPWKGWPLLHSCCWIYAKIQLLGFFPLPLQRKVAQARGARETRAVLCSWWWSKLGTAEGDGLPSPGAQQSFTMRRIAFGESKKLYFAWMQHCLEDVGRYKGDSVLNRRKRRSRKRICLNLLKVFQTIRLIYGWKNVRKEALQR